MRSPAVRPHGDGALLLLVGLNIVTILELFVIPALCVLSRRFEGRDPWLEPSPAQR